MFDGVPNHAPILAYDVVDPHPVDDYIAHKLDSDSSTIGNVDSDAATIDGLVALHDELLLENDEHVAVKYDPQWLLLDHGMPEGSRSRVYEVVVASIRDDVERAVLATGGLVAKP